MRPSVIGLISLIEIFSGAITDAAKWGYIGDTGVERWASLFPEACSGDFQSPIDIQKDNTIYDPRLRQFSIFYDPPAPGSKFVVLNNGHSIQVNTEGRFYVTNGGLQNIYSTAQFHFHWGHKSHHGSEHTLDGVASPIEMHIVNWNSERYSSIADAVTEPAGLAVLGIMFKLSEKDNPVLEPLVQVLMHIRDPDMKLQTEIPAVSMNAFLPPAAYRYFRYNGSLTTPGCFESVVWTVFSEKQTISRRQLHVFRQVLKPAKKESTRHRRSSNHQFKMVNSVFEELGIEDPDKLSRFRRELEKKHVTGATSGSQHNETVTGKASSHEHHAGTKPEARVETGPTYDTQNDRMKMTNLRNMLVNNFRPVQPLNGRTVYRSYPFVNEPISLKTEVVYVDIDNSEGYSSAMLTTATCLTFLSTVLATICH